MHASTHHASLSLLPRTLFYMIKDPPYPEIHFAQRTSTAPLVPYTLSLTPSLFPLGGEHMILIADQCDQLVSGPSVHG